VSEHPTDFQGSVSDAITAAIRSRIDGAKIEVTGGGGHYAIVVTAGAFAGRSALESQRMVYGAIAHLMKGDTAPVHAVDSLRTLTA
jgi:acid stress-induced BolA-like protein IbaG/YrbA